MDAVLRIGTFNSGVPVFVCAGCDADDQAYLVLDAETSYCYDVDKTWSENLAQGLPRRCQQLAPVERRWVPEDKLTTFLNHKIASPLGVAAGPLLSAEWVALAASRGYDCLTYKTIRSHYHPGHGLPNILHLQVDEQLPASGQSCHKPLFATRQRQTWQSSPHLATAHAATYSAGTSTKLQSAPGCRGAANGATNALGSGCGGGSGSMLAITNSFGMPSQGPQELVGDLRAAAASLRPGQMMVVSVTGTPGRPGLTFAEDLALAARTALEGGATALEVNLSCPNVGASHVALYQDAPAVEATVAGLAEVVGDVPLAVKVGSFPKEDTDGLRRVLAAAARAGARAVAGINGLSRRVELAAGGGPALGPDRPTSGVCGDPIREAGLDFVTQARKVVASENLGLGIIGVGGVTHAEHAMEYLHAGADVVQAATGFMWRPNLGLDFQRLWAAAGYMVPPADGRGGRA